MYHLEFIKIEIITIIPTFRISCMRKKGSKQEKKKKKDNKNVVIK